jgi:hypothetical protein
MMPVAVAVALVEPLSSWPRLASLFLVAGPVDRTSGRKGIVRFDPSFVRLPKKRISFVWCVDYILHPRQHV